MLHYAHPLVQVQQQINRMFDQFDGDLFSRMENLGEGMFSPAVDVKEDADAYTVHLEVPGVSQDNINITLQDDVLTISGIKEQKHDSNEGRFRRVERSYGSFSRSISLPRGVDGNCVVANLEDGVLEVRLPKREEARPRQINIGVTRDVQAINGSSANGSFTNGGSAPSLIAQSNGGSSPASPQTGEESKPAEPQPEDGNTQANGGDSEDAPEGNPT